MIISEKNIIQYVTNNPGLTAAMIGKLLRRPYGTTSSILCQLATAKKLERRLENAERSNKPTKDFYWLARNPRTLAWRYYPITKEKESRS